MLGTWEVGQGRVRVRGDGERSSRSLFGTWKAGQGRGRVPPCEERGRSTGKAGRRALTHLGEARTDNVGLTSVKPGQIKEGVHPPI